MFKCSPYLSRKLLFATINSSNISIFLSLSRTFQRMNTSARLAFMLVKTHMPETSLTKSLLTTLAPIGMSQTLGTLSEYPLPCVSHKHYCHWKCNMLELLCIKIPMIHHYLYKLDQDQYKWNEWELLHVVLLTCVSDKH